MRDNAVLRWRRALAALATVVLAVTGAAVAAAPASAAAGEVSGTVVLPAGENPAAMEAVTINLWDQGGDYDEYVQPDPETGEFSFTGVDAGEYALWVNFDSYYDEALDQWVLPNLAPLAMDITIPAGGLDNLTLTLEKGLSISGHIDLPAGTDPAAYQGMYVTAMGEGPGWGGSEVDPLTGDYTIVGLAEDTYVVRVETGTYWDEELGKDVMPNLMSQYFEGAYTWDDASWFTLTEDVTEINFSLEAGSTITGTLSVAPGATLLEDEFLEIYAHGVTTDDSRYGTVDSTTGDYVITGLLPGEYIIEATGSGAWNGSEEDWEWIPSLLAREYYDNAYTWMDATPVYVDGTEDGIDIELVEGVSVSGTVSVPSGTPDGWWQGVEVQVGPTTDEYEAYGWGQPEADGSYTVTGLPPVDAVVRFSAYSYWDDETDEEVPASLLGEFYDDVMSFEDATVLALATGDKSGIDAELAEGYSISGNVRLEAGVDPALWGYGVSVIAESIDEGAYSYAHTMVDPVSGDYTLSGLYPVEHVVTFLPEGTYDEETDTWTPSSLVTEYWDDQTSWELADPIDLASGSATGIDAELAAGGTISGTVTVPAGTDAHWYQGAEVWAYDEFTGVGQWSAIAPDGTYLLAGLPDGEYVIEFYAWEYWDEELEEYIALDLQGEFYDDVANFWDATPVVIEDGANVTGIDAELTPEGPAGSGVTLTDIATNPFRTEILWLAATGVTTGWDNGDGTASFRPLRNVNRDQMAAFLYRMAGSPEFEDPATPTFTDVPKKHVFYTEIEWLAETGITTGWTVNGKKEFRPTTAVNRDVMAAFLYRFADEPEFTAPSKSPFKDVSKNHVFYKEISWLADAGISEGWSVKGGREFRPTLAVKRDVMAAFLYRFSNNAI